MCVPRGGNWDGVGVGVGVVSRSEGCPVCFVALKAEARGASQQQAIILLPPVECGEHSGCQGKMGGEDVKERKAWERRLAGRDWAEGRMVDEGASWRVLT